MPSKAALIRIVACRVCGTDLHILTDAGAIETNWHRIGTKDLIVFGSWAFTANDIPDGIAMLDRARDRYPWSAMQTLLPFTEQGLDEAVQAALDMRTVKSTIVPNPDLLEENGA